MIELMALLATGAAGWFVWDSLQAREAANAAIRPACSAAGFLFLDDTVALHRVRPARDDDGRLRVGRIYRFDYSDTGDNRRRGFVALLGARVLRVDLGQDTRATNAGPTLH